jgi:hypothetical protein
MFPPKPIPTELCCENFVKAFQYETDNEGYGSLFDFDNGNIITGLDLPPIEYCPWCGMKINKTAFARSE